MTLIRLRVGIALIVLSVAMHGCGVYSFTGGGTQANTITIEDIYNNADMGPANMGQDLTNQLKNYFVQNTKLSVVQEDGELHMTGEISGYTLSQIAPVATGQPDDFNPASMTRLTITVRISYTDTIDETKSFRDKTFSFYKDFPNDQNLSDVEDAYVREIFERLVNDIFNASVANW
ncbi:MAG TPA: LptE family protein [Cyclobacteriaceae bacterium]|nr:LptE family protein [Cyclobacteriaceae bacterium]